MRKLMALAIRNPTLNGVSKDGFYLGTKDGSTTARADGQLKSGRGEKDFDDHMCAHHYKVAAQLPQHARAEGEQSSSSEPMEAEAECGNEFAEAALAVTRPSMSPGKAMKGGVPPTHQPEGAAPPDRDKRCCISGHQCFVTNKKQVRLLGSKQWLCRHGYFLVPLFGGD
jgi:hypothetical protein